MNHKFYQKLKVEEKKKVRELIDNVVRLRKEQIEIFEKNIIKCLKDDIKMALDVKKNQVSLNHWRENCSRGSQYVQDFLKITKGDRIE